MNCPNCGANIKNDEIYCPYCKSKIYDSLISRKKDEMIFQNRKNKIDKFFGKRTAKSSNCRFEFFKL